MFYNFNIDKNFRGFLNFCFSGASKVGNVIVRDDLVLPIGDYIKVEEVGFVSYIPKSKIVSGDNEFNQSIQSRWDSKHRTKIKIGRFVKKIIKKECFDIYQITSDDIEIFVNIFKSYFDDDTSKLVMVEGEEILKWYLDYNYHMVNGNRCVGTLWNSCMRYSDRNKFMRIYADNPDKVKMLIKLDVSGKLIARSLLWESCEDPKGNKYKIMDRIYTVYDHDVVTFKSWAKENGYVSKVDQSSKSEMHFDTCTGGEYIKLSVKLPNHNFFHYPYLDTFKFYDSENGVFSNWERNYKDHILVQGNGSMYREEGNEDDE